MQIGEISRVLGMKPETIRYYEKEGIISPQRKKGGTFRKYSMWDFFDLHECRRFRLMDFSIKDIKRLMRNESLEEIAKMLSEKQLEIYAEANQKLLFAAEMKSLADRISNAPLNIGNYWFKAEEEKIGINLTERCGKRYADPDADSLYLQSWLGSYLIGAHMHVLADDIMERRDRNEWFLCTSLAYFKALHLPEQEIFHIPEQVYLHTVLDIGGKESLAAKMLEPVLAYVKDKGIEIDNYIIGEFLVRCREGRTLHRYVEVMVPIKTQAGSRVYRK